MRGQDAQLSTFNNYELNQDRLPAEDRYNPNDLSFGPTHRDSSGENIRQTESKRRQMRETFGLD